MLRQHLPCEPHAHHVESTAAGDFEGSDSFFRQEQSSQTLQGLGL